MVDLSAVSRRFSPGLVGALVLACLAGSPARALPVQHIDTTPAPMASEGTVQLAQYSAHDEQVRRYRHWERHQQIRHDEQVMRYRRWERHQQIRHDEGVLRHRAWERRHRYGY